jgi:hypothetical protein
MRCRRCETDFTAVIHAVQQAEELAKQARIELKQEPTEDAFWKALQALQIHVSEETLKSLALAAMGQRRFPLALWLWSQSKESPSNE